MSSIRIEIEEPKKIDEMLGRLDISLRLNTLQKGLRGASRIVVSDATRRVARSEKTGTRKKWSKAVREKRQGKGGLADSLGSIVKNYAGSQAVVAVIGPRRPQGSHGHLVEGGHEAVYWGRRTGARIEGKEFLAPAADTTRQEQQAAIVTQIQTAIETHGV